MGDPSRTLNGLRSSLRVFTQFDIEFAHTIAEKSTRQPKRKKVQNIDFVFTRIHATSSGTIEKSPHEKKARCLDLQIHGSVRNKLSESGPAHFRVRGASEKRTPCDAQSRFLCRTTLT